MAVHLSETLTWPGIQFLPSHHRPQSIILPLFPSKNKHFLFLNKPHFSTKKMTIKSHWHNKELLLLSHASAGQMSQFCLALQVYVSETDQLHASNTGAQDGGPEATGHVLPMAHGASL